MRYIHRTIPREMLAALFRGSKAGLVTPLRDGMNLVAKEYIAAQDDDDPGVLVLSRFAGAAEDLEEALIVNPYDIDDVAHALEQALKMPLDERCARHQGAVQARARARRHELARKLPGGAVAAKTGSSGMRPWRLVADVGGSNVRFARAHQQHALGERRTYALTRACELLRRAWHVPR